ncbi:MAG: hypothetical protein QOI24_1398 [Acidobacteriota bacterium]|jgi:hypothetical protein|nr:hypothetical protein [Acidobacteriota bacterium]
MPESIKYAGSASVPGGPALSFSETLSLDVFSKANIVVENGADVTVPFSGNVRLLMIRASAYTGLKFAVAPSTTAQALDQPLIVAGTGLLEIVSPGGLTSITFSTTDTKPATLDIFVAFAP